MKRQRIDVDLIASRENLLHAAWQASRGKHLRPEVQQFFDSLEDRLRDLSDRIHNADVPCGTYRSFLIRDPKLRVIHAPAFEDRVIHHAIVRQIGPRLDATLVDSSYACRKGKGSLAAVKATERAIRRFPWYVKIDVEGYFNHIDHEILMTLLRSRFKGEHGLSLLDRIIDSYRFAAGRGLPIGALTSQYFANFYLDGVDRFVKETLHAKAHVRYMDDIVWFTDQKSTAREQLAAVGEWIGEHRKLVLKPQSRTQRSPNGVTFCGYRVHRDGLYPTRRRRRRYRVRRKSWEEQWRAGLLSANELQQCHASVHATLIHSKSRGFRDRCLIMQPPPEV